MKGIIFMKNSFLYVILSIIILGIIGFGFYYFSNNPSSNTIGPEPHRISTETNTYNNSNLNTINEEKKSTPKETILSSFSTKILIDDDNRDTNLEITASKINGTIVKKGEEFSFNKVVGNPTEEKGYEKAGAFGANGKKIKTYGGGNCQVSSTLYNAALKADLKVTERHQHEREVGYVELGKDATVAYDYLDLKFKNTSGTDIKIYANVTKEKVEVKIVKLS